MLERSGSGQNIELHHKQSYLRGLRVAGDDDVYGLLSCGGASPRAHVLSGLKVVGDVELMFGPV
jgi:hypothetical protein